jgi:hypothetical protein
MKMDVWEKSLIIADADLIIKQRKDERKKSRRKGGKRK